MGLPYEGYGEPGPAVSRLLTGTMAMEMCRVDASVATFFGVHNGLAMYAIQAGGDQEQRDRWLPVIARMETVGVFALSEPLDGSDIAAGMRTTARRDGDAWVIEGAKQFREAVGGRRCSKRSLPWLVCPVHPLRPLS
ncbi:alkylation response protein AidB-like acyl-CoA dehydrogenase [Streptomyces sp. DSM 42143]|uniref:acyl-CoA dehydrogenase family protein n=1 Tax=unclassified Streptomyces TaxID=2593676 RepID=UPI00211BBFB0|nr:MULTISPECIES: acyl-CoA dehydrogenase family protein [unclassified Streptomyces]MDN3247570.1 acyl-CoA dehydrogenase family protein [Streptomyces sp. ZSW22]MDQ0383330.1 alkylation response protein AidB-like acyl-CoA dehydrogenase [Streptomyces sp. DSM 42143]